MKDKDEPHFAWFKCLDRGVVKMELTDFISCNNKKCEPCIKFSKSLEDAVQESFLESISMFNEIEKQASDDFKENWMKDAE